MRALTDAERYPLLTGPADVFLRGLLQHPAAPTWNYRCGDRLTADGLARVRAFERALVAAPPQQASPPAWVREFAATCLRHVPAYRDRGGTPDDLATVPTSGRADLARAPWQFVPDDQPLDELIVYDTSGRTGHPVLVPSHPAASSMYLPLLRAGLATRGVILEDGGGRVAIVNVCAQRQTFTFASVSSYLGWAGFAKVNLNPAEWRDPDDRVRFLESCAPQVYTGDPLAFWSLATLPVTTMPKALVSTAMAMSTGLASHLEARFQCPIIDLYSLTESGPVAVGTSQGHRLLPHDVYVEILDERGQRCPPGVRGEITITGGRNPFLPLLRYRTGDWAALDWFDGLPHLVGLEGRPPTVFRDDRGHPFNNVDVTTALRHLRLPLYHLHQHRDGRVTCSTLREATDEVALRSALATVFGPRTAVEIDEVDDLVPDSGKLVQYSSDIAVAAPPGLP